MGTVFFVSNIFEISLNVWISKRNRKGGGRGKGEKEEEGKGKYREEQGEMHGWKGTEEKGKGRKSGRQKG